MYLVCTFAFSGFFPYEVHLLFTSIQRNCKCQSGRKLSNTFKYLNYFQECEIVESETDIQSGEYPRPKLYRVIPDVLPIIQIIPITEYETLEIETILSDPKKTPLDVLDQINTKNNVMLLLALKMYKEGEWVSPEFLDLILE